MRHPHHFKIAIALAISAGAWGIYWLPQRILEEGGLTGGWGTISQMIIGVILLLPIAIWRKAKGKTTGLEIPLTGFLIGGGFICYALSFLLTDVVRALILFYMTPIWTTIFEILFSEMDSLEISEKVETTLLESRILDFLVTCVLDAQFGHYQNKLMFFPG